jgi:hypothetical protein
MIERDIVWLETTQETAMPYAGGRVAGSIRVRSRRGDIFVEKPASERSVQALQNFIGRVNRDQLALINHLADPETLLLAYAAVEGFFSATGERMYRMQLTFCACETEGVREDDTYGSLGWNRVYFPRLQCFKRLTKLLYPLAEDCDPEGFAALLS